MDSMLGLAQQLLVSKLQEPVHPALSASNLYVSVSADPYIEWSCINLPVFSQATLRTVLALYCPCQVS